jgi:hypothetical protein
LHWYREIICITEAYAGSFFNKHVEKCVEGCTLFFTLLKVRGLVFKWMIKSHISVDTSTTMIFIEKNWKIEKNFEIYKWGWNFCTGIGTLYVLQKHMQVVFLNKNVEIYIVG